MRGDVLEFGVAEVLVETVIVIDVGDEDVFQAVVVEVGDDRLTRLARPSIGALPRQTSRLGDIGEVAFAIIQIEGVARSAQHEHVDVAIIIECPRPRCPIRRTQAARRARACRLP